MDKPIIATGKRMRELGLSFLILLLYVVLMTQLLLVQSVDLPTVSKVPKTSLPTIVLTVVHLMEIGGEPLLLVQPLIWAICIGFLCSLFLRNWIFASIGVLITVVVATLSFYVENSIGSSFALFEGGSPISVPTLSVVLMEAAPEITTIIVPAIVAALLYRWGLRRKRLGTVTDPLKEEPQCL